MVASYWRALNDLIPISQPGIVHVMKTLLTGPSPLAQRHEASGNCNWLGTLHLELVYDPLETIVLHAYV